MYQLLGIRHHGPGSARAVLKALKANPPDCLLIEAPADAEPLLKYLQPPKEKPESDSPLIPEPPVAALIYNPKQITQASYLPFANFSPEWQAIRFALEQQIPVHFIDLPMELHFGLDLADQQNPQGEMDFWKKMTPDERAFRRDPMGHLAHLAGYTDSERWWEVMFESVENETEIFQAILEMTTALREKTEESPRTLQREAFMRKCIRKAQKEGFEKLTVVCGAWHVPALHDLKEYKSSHDNALLRGIKKVKTQATWIPWSYDKLTFQSGYRSGVISPAWYELLFLNRNEAATRWMVNVARLFRSEDLDASSAHVIEAIRLANTLSALRNLAIPGIDELKEAAVTTICEGSEEKLDWIERKLITGKKVGRVPDSIPVVPLQKDIEQSIKSARLTKYWGDPDEQWLGATNANPRGGIDLRTDAGKLKSHLLHRLNLLDIPWGKQMDVERHFTAGGFTEFWQLQWAPEFAIRIIEMGAWGNTVEEACVQFLKKKTEETNALPALTDLVADTLNADLPEAFDTLLQKLENLAALTTDVYHLMDALPPLARIVKYGNTRGTDVGTVEKVVSHLVPRICIGLPGAASNLDEEASADAYRRLQGVNRALGTLNEPAYNTQWFRTLQVISQSKQVNGLLRGACTRILFDKKIISEEEMAMHVRYALSRGAAPLGAAQWLEGFLQGSGLLLLHNHALWNLLDEWIAELGEEAFNEVLVLLRRTFSRFSQPERERMMKLARQGQVAMAENGEDSDFEEARGKMVLPVLKQLLGH